MAKVKPTKQENVHNSGLGGTRVVIQFSDAVTVPITISLPCPCSWNGVIIETSQKFVTDNGRLVVYLPPSSELTPLIPRYNSPVMYRVGCAITGDFVINVPQAEEWVVGTNVSNTHAR